MTYHLIGSVTGPALDFPGLVRELDVAVGAVEVVRMIRVAAPTKRLAVNDRTGHNVLTDNLHTLRLDVVHDTVCFW